MLKTWRKDCFIETDYKVDPVFGTIILQTEKTVTSYIGTRQVI